MSTRARTIILLNKIHKVGKQGRTARQRHLCHEPQCDGRYRRVGHPRQDKGEVLRCMILIPHESPDAQEWMDGLLQMKCPGATGCVTLSFFVPPISLPSMFLSCGALSSQYDNASEVPGAGLRKAKALFVLFVRGRYRSRGLGKRRRLWMTDVSMRREPAKGSADVPEGR